MRVMRIAAVMVSFYGTEISSAVSYCPRQRVCRPTRAANAGATVAELEAIFGWSSGRMASLYTRSAGRRRLARRAMHKLGNET
jgi:hypothetical protein